MKSVYTHDNPTLIILNCMAIAIESHSCCLKLEIPYT